MEAQKRNRSPKGPWLKVRALIAAVFFATVVWLVVSYVFRPQYRGYYKLLAAIERSDETAVSEILASGQDPDVHPNDQWSLMLEEDLTLLDVAADNGDIEIVRILLDAGADPNMGDGWYISPLAAAAEGEHLAVMELLIERGAVVNDSDGGSYSLWRAAMDGKVKSVQFLLERGANPNTTFSVPDQRTLLQCLREVSPNAEIESMLQAAIEKGAGKPD